jgi:transcriptional regulator with XRE-family HTH domain
MTVVMVEPVASTEAPLIFGPPGTQAPTPSAPRAAKLIIPLVFGMTLGTVASISPAEALALQQQVVRPTVGADIGTGASRMPLPWSIAEYVAILRRRSGLTWGEFADAVGVSRRAVHLWASGKRVSPRHVERLALFASVLALYEVDSPEETRERLTIPQGGRPSALATLNASNKRVRRTPMSGISFSDALAADGTANPPGRTSDRPSSLKAPKLGQGGNSAS